MEKRRFVLHNDDLLIYFGNLPLMVFPSENNGLDEVIGIEGGDTHVGICLVEVGKHFDYVWREEHRLD